MARRISAASAVARPFRRVEYHAKAASQVGDGMDRAGVRSLQRGLIILDALGTADGMPLGQLHQLTGLPKPTLLRLLATLQAEGFVGQRLTDGAWRRTMRSRAVPGRADKELLLDHSGGPMRALCHAIGWPCDLAIYKGGAMEIIETTRRLSPFAIRDMPAGARIPMLTSGLGRAWLAWNGPAEDMPAFAPQTAILADIIEETRRAGYGRRVASYFDPFVLKCGDMGVAVPIPVNGRVLGCLSVVWHRSAMDEASFVRRHLSPLSRAAKEIGMAIAASI